MTNTTTSTTYHNKRKKLKVSKSKPHTTRLPKPKYRELFFKKLKHKTNDNRE